MKISWLIAHDCLTGKILLIMRFSIDNSIKILKRLISKGAKQAYQIWKVKPHYLLVVRWNLTILYDIVNRIDQLSFTSYIVECNFLNRGSAAIMAHSRFESPSLLDRAFWLFDYFSKLPGPYAKRG